jgi:glutamate transport system permease protein
MELIFTKYLDQAIDGLLITLRLTASSFVLAMILGCILAAFRISPIGPLRVFGMLFVEFFRNIPVMCLIILVVYALPDIRIMFSFEDSVLLALTCVGASFICEAMRTGINSIDPGQIEAARSIGLGFVGVCSAVVFPQALRSMIQPFITTFIGMFLSSSLAGVVGVTDLTESINRISNREALGIGGFFVAAMVYLGISLGVGAIGAQLEKRLRVVR